MKMTQKGKIGRLPVAVREQLNVRLQDGATGTEIVPWLNELPEVRELLAREFEDKAITEQNLSDWRNSGYAQWVRLQNDAGQLELWQEFAAEVDQSIDKERVWSGISVIMTVNLWALHQKMMNEEMTVRERWGYLKELSKILTELRKSEAYFFKRKLDRERERKRDQEQPLKQAPSGSELERAWDELEQEREQRARGPGPGRMNGARAQTATATRKTGVSTGARSGAGVPANVVVEANDPTLGTLGKELIEGGPKWPGDMLDHPGLQPFKELAWANVPAIKTMTETQLAKHISDCLRSPQWATRNAKVLGKEFMRKVVGVRV